MSEQTICDNCGKVITSARVYTREDALGMDFCTRLCRDIFDDYTLDTTKLIR